MRIVFMGTGEIALPTLRWLLGLDGEHELVGIFSQPDRKVGRKQILTPPEVKSLGEAAGVEVVQPESFRKEPESVERLAEWSPDLVVVMAYGQILPRTVIEAPRIACVNLHASLLPRHRGASPIQAAIREGDGETGLTLMHVVPKLDAGAMLLKEKIPILPDDTGGSLHDRLAELGPPLLEKALPRLAEGSLASIPQDESAVTYAEKLERDDGRIDWSRDAASIERLVRAYDPWPGAFTRLVENGAEKKLKIYPSTRIHEGGDAPSGTVIESDERLLVGCGDGSLELSGDLQMEGRKRLPAPEFLRGTDLRAGAILGGDPGAP